MPSVPPRTPLVPQARTARRHFVLKPNYNSLAPPRCGGSQPRRNGYVSCLCAAKLAKGSLIDIITAQTFGGVRMQTLVDAAACAAGLQARIVEAVAAAPAKACRRVRSRLAPDRDEVMAEDDNLSCADQKKPLVPLKCAKHFD